MLSALVKHAGHKAWAQGVRIARRVKEGGLRAQMEQHLGFAIAFDICARTGTGVEALEDALEDAEREASRLVRA